MLERTGGPAPVQRSVEYERACSPSNAYATPPISMKLRQFQDDCSRSSSLRSMKLLKGNQLSMVLRRLRAGLAGRVDVALSARACLCEQLGMMASTSSSTSAKALRSSGRVDLVTVDLRVVDVSSSSSLKFIKLFRREDERGGRLRGRGRPSRQASASMRLLRRSWELMDSEREDADRRTGRVGESSRPTAVEAERFFESGVEDGGERAMGVAGISGNMVEGAGLGEGMLRNDSLDVRRRVVTTGVGDVVMMGFSVRLTRREKGMGEMMYGMGRTQRHDWISRQRCMSSWWIWTGSSTCVCEREDAACGLQGRGRGKSGARGCRAFWTGV